jgi:hypothetical protein
MQKLLAPVLALFLQAVLAAPPPVEMDPNTRIQGGADPRGSGAAAGAGVRRDGKMDTEPRVESPGNAVERPDKVDPDKDKPISERKPSEREKADERKTTLPNP